MINCDLCGKDIGSVVEPIFAANNDAVVCRVCCEEIEGQPPSSDRAEYDQDELGSVN